jgi:broad specificity phosphatase PhoE
MARLRRVVLLRHGETVGESSVRFHGATDVALSGLGIDQARAAGRKIGSEAFELVVASPLQRAWKTATLVAPGRPVRLEAGFREIDFGRWEGLTREEIETRDPDRYRVWQENVWKFAFPDGEGRDTFRARVVTGIENLLTLDPASVLIACHKGVVRTIAEELAGVVLDPESPALGHALELEREPDADWQMRFL